MEPLEMTYFYRLNILEVHIPTLRERKRDIIPLFRHFLERSSDYREDLKLKCEDEDKLINYSWPGNVRELRNIAERYIIFEELDINEDEIIKYDSESLADNELRTEEIIDLKRINRFVEEKVIEMLSSKGMNKTEIAKQLGISRTALWKKTKT